MAEPLVSIRGLGKSFGGVQALSEIDLDISPGEVHALCGENGAGKSTLIKTLGGILVPDTGAVTFQGESLPFGSVRKAEDRGITVIHQESVAFPHLNAVDNLFVGREVRRWGCFLDRGKMQDETVAMLQQLGENIDLHRPMGDFPLAQRQMVAIARALLQNCRLLIMDEPTASLSERETRVLFDRIRRLRSDGVSVLYVSHRLHEVFELADTVTVFRDGRWVSTDRCDALNQDTLIQRMVGRSITGRRDGATRNIEAGRPRLTVRGLTRVPAFEDISFDVYAGEVFGLAGLVGAGRSEVARCIFGIDGYVRGSIEIDSVPLEPGTVRGSCRAGVALVPEDRQHEGLIQEMAIWDNFGLPWLEKKSTWGCLRRRAVTDLAEAAAERLDVRFGHLRDPVSSLSGGNQQKVVLGKWLAGKPGVLILDEPTRGVDVGAKEEVYRLISELATEGVAVLLISSDLPEVLRLSDRIGVMCEGHLQGELIGHDATEESILRLALPGYETELNSKGETS